MLKDTFTQATLSRTTARFCLPGHLVPRLLIFALLQFLLFLLLPLLPPPPSSFFLLFLACRAQLDSYAILGRASVDVIKSGGYKLSALEIERMLLAHPQVAECAVLGLSDPEWGEVVAAVVVPKCVQKKKRFLRLIFFFFFYQKKKKKHSFSPSSLCRGKLDDEELKTWCKGEMSGYKIPRIVKIVPELERNALGKINKKALRKSLEQA